MVTITLPPELESIVTETAQQQGTTPELFLLNDLQKRYLPAKSQGEELTVEKLSGTYHIYSPRLLYPEQYAALVKEMIVEESDAAI